MPAPQNPTYDNLTSADLDRITRRLTAPGTVVCTQPGSCALRDALALVAEARRLRIAHTLLTVRHADLLAAARATLAAHGDGEADPLGYLRDELAEIEGLDQLEHPDDLDELLDLDGDDADAPIAYRLADTARLRGDAWGWPA